MTLSELLSLLVEQGCSVPPRGLCCGFAGMSVKLSACQAVGDNSLIMQLEEIYIAVLIKVHQLFSSVTSLRSPKRQGFCSSWFRRADNKYRGLGSCRNQSVFLPGPWVILIQSTPRAFL